MCLRVNNFHELHHKHISAQQAYSVQTTQNWVVNQWWETLKNETGYFFCLFGSVGVVGVALDEIPGSVVPSHVAVIQGEPGREGGDENAHGQIPVVPRLYSLVGRTEGFLGRQILVHCGSFVARDGLAPRGDSPLNAHLGQVPEKDGSARHGSKRSGG